MNQSKIYVGNLAYNVDNQQLESFFSQYGEIVEAKVIMDRATGRSKGFGFVTFASDDQAQKALQANDAELDGRKMRVNIAEDKPRRTGGAGGSRGRF